MVHFGCVGKKQAASSFAEKKVVICIQELSLRFVQVVLYTPCALHVRNLRLCVVKDTMKDNYERPFFVCSERKNPCKYWQWGDVFEGPRPLCQHGMVVSDGVWWWRIIISIDCGGGASSLAYVIIICNDVTRASLGK